jgi:hypothetical protein
MSSDNDIAGTGAPRRSVRTTALLLTSLALGFYFAFIAMTIYRNHRG